MVVISYKKKKASLLEDKTSDGSLTKCVDCTKGKDNWLMLFIRGNDVSNFVLKEGRKFN